MPLEIPERFLASASGNPLASAFPRPGPDLSYDRYSSKPVEGGNPLEGLLSGGSAPKAAYLSIPFCRSFCSYCGFNKVRHGSGIEESYLPALFDEMDLEAGTRAVREAEIEAAYFGGGTPSVLSPANILKALGEARSRLRLGPRAEVTFEGRLSALDQEREAAVWAGGATRLSIGIQSFDLDVRRRAGRLDPPGQVRRQLEGVIARRKGLVAIDLIYGLPGQSVQVFLEDLRAASGIGADDLSVYQLKLMPKAPLRARIEGGKEPPIPGMAEMAAFHLAGAELLEKLGYRQLSAHHWSRGGQDKNLFNRLSVARKDLLAYGLGAGGRLGGASFGNTTDMGTYLEMVGCGRKPLARFRPAPPLRHLLDPVSEMVMEGHLDKRAMDALDPRLSPLAGRLLDQWAKAGLAEAAEDGWHLTFAGLYWRGSMESYLRQWLEMGL